MIRNTAAATAVTALATLAGLVGLAPTLALAASTPSPSAFAHAAAACSLLDTTTVEDLVGGTPTSPGTSGGIVVYPSQRGDQCSWAVRGRGTVTITILARGADTTYAYYQALDAAASWSANSYPALGETVAPLQGVNDDLASAVTSTVAGGLGVILSLPHKGLVVRLSLDAPTLFSPVSRCRLGRPGLLAHLSPPCPTGPFCGRGSLGACHFRAQSPK